jgi:hypothetical protein
MGTILFTTPVRNALIELHIRLCGTHLNALMKRDLRPSDFKALQAQFELLGISTDDVFMLHDSFYSHEGLAKQPMKNAW